MSTENIENTETQEENVFEEVENLLEGAQDEQEEQEEVQEEEPEELVYAKSKGWKPKDEWDGDPEEWVSHKTFNKNEKLFSKINNQAKQLTASQQALAQLRADINKITKTIAEQTKSQMEGAKSRLSARKIEALRQGEYEQAEAIEAKLRVIDRELEEEDGDEEEKVAPVSVVTAEDWNSAFSEWTAENTWYNKNESLKELVHSHLKSLVHDNPSIMPDEALEKVTKVMSKIIRPLQKKQGTTLSSSSRPSAPGKKNILSGEMRELAKNLIDTLGISEDEFMKTYSKL